MSESDKTIGYERGRKGESRSWHWNDNWFESQQTAKDREAGFQEGKRDRINSETGKKK